MPGPPDPVLALGKPKTSEGRGSVPARTGGILPELDEDDICPECGTDWGQGEDCDEDCPLGEAYQSEMDEED